MSDRLIAMAIGAGAGAPYWWSTLTEPPTSGPPEYVAVVTSPVTALVVTVGVAVLTYWALYGFSDSPTFGQEADCR